MAWSRWIIGDSSEITIKKLQINKAELLIVAGTAANEFIQLKADLHIQNDEKDRVHIDYKYISLANESIILPPSYPATDITLVQGTGCPRPGDTLAYMQAGSTLTLDEDMLGGIVYAGQTYRSAYRPSTVIIRDETGFAQSSAKLRIVRWIATVSDTGELHSQIISPYYDFPPFEYYGIVGHDIISQYDDPNINTHDLIIPFKQDAKLANLELYTESWTPAEIVSLDWVGGYGKRGRRL